MFTTTQPVTVVCFRTLFITMTGTLAPSPKGLTTLGQHDVVLLPQVFPRDTLMSSTGLTTLPQQQQPQYQMPSQAYASYAMGPVKVHFLYRVEPPTNFLFYVGFCYDLCFLLSGFHVAAMFPNGGSTIGGFGVTTLHTILLGGICAS